MTTHLAPAADEFQIRQLVDSWPAAICLKDVEALMSHYTSDILLYDLALPLLHRVPMRIAKAGRSGSIRFRVRWLRGPQLECRGR